MPPRASPKSFLSTNLCDLKICSNSAVVSLHLLQEYVNYSTYIPYGWGYTIYRAAFGPESDGRFAAGVKRLEDWLRFIVLQSCYDAFGKRTDLPSNPDTDLNTLLAERLYNEVIQDYSNKEKNISGDGGREARILHLLGGRLFDDTGRHHNAIVVRDPSSQRLEIRGLHECPTCHQPLRPASPDRHYDTAHHGETYVDPNYFRMLRAGHSDRSATPPRPPPSPIRRLVEPVPAVVHDDNEGDAGLQDAEFMSSSPAPPSGGRIRREAFSPHYFHTFFIEERELGRGGKGVVLLVRHEIDGCNLGHFACKRVPVGDDHAWLEKVLVEVELLAKLVHPNLVSYRHVWLEDVQLTRFGPSVACAFILQQYCNGGDLLHYVIGDMMPKEATKEELKAQMRRRSRGQAERPKLQKRLPPEEIYSLFKDVTSGLAYLHAANYIHRDLKPSNCLLHRDGSQLKCLISDFGEVQPENAVRKSTGSTGTISYCAPEVLKKDASGTYGNFTTKSDIFSLGMILYFMCFGRLPYLNANSVNEELEDIDQLRAEISHWKGFQEERKERPDLPAKLYQLLKKLLAVNAADRPTAKEVLGAMGGDSNLDGMMRGSRNTSPLLNLSSQRIQNLDSPSLPAPQFLTLTNAPA
ncbi:putative serine/threonine-protein kinase iks1 [Collariella sp. IMI 366227]|nr:putative serine/threonine-protein kinase iks1 [Collariella sp. IMI 366227]